ncbi:MAG: cyclic nucleotide-binding domain-containing protein, partial [Anaerolineae bacterium]|nr:cyclic nucleotide-binding domain-containing protein [Anaerolineae bacterium]
DPVHALQRIPLFHGLDYEHLRGLAEACRLQQAKRNQLLFHKGDAANGFYFILSGQIKLFHLTEDGHERVLEILNAGMSFGEAVMFIGQPFPANAQCLAASELLFIGREAVLELLGSDPQVALKMLASLSRRLHGLVQDMEVLTLYSSSQRVIGYLLSLCTSTTGPCMIKLPAAKAVIASRLNLTPETFSR